eukprot:COSAG04_NODE_173_length_21572_cov_104.574256_9_plen_326_part_00
MDSSLSLEVAYSDCQAASSAFRGLFGFSSAGSLPRWITMMLDVATQLQAAQAPTPAVRRCMEALKSTMSVLASRNDQMLRTTHGGFHQETLNPMRACSLDVKLVDGENHEIARMCLALEQGGVGAPRVNGIHQASHTPTDGRTYTLRVESTQTPGRGELCTLDERAYRSFVQKTKAKMRDLGPMAQDFEGTVELTVQALAPVVARAAGAVVSIGIIGEAGQPGAGRALFADYTVPTTPSFIYATSPTAPGPQGFGMRAGSDAPIAVVDHAGAVVTVTRGDKLETKQEKPGTGWDVRPLPLPPASRHPRARGKMRRAPPDLTPLPC